MMKRQLLYIAISVLLFGCTTYSTAPRKSALRPSLFGSEGSEPISFARVIIRIPPGTPIGTEFVAKSKKGANPIYWRTHLALGDEELKLTALEEMERYGYAAVGTDQVLFQTSARQKSRFLLGGVITELTFDRYLPKAGNYSSSRIVVDWQLYDTNLGKTVFRTKTQASARKDNDLSSGAVTLSFAKALDDLLTRKEFVALVRKRTEAAVPAKQEVRLSMPTCSPVGPLFLPENLERALESVVIVKAGEYVGTGVIISREGYALTAYHVVDGAPDLQVELKSGLSLHAEILRFNAEYDLALLKFTGRGHACLPLRIGSRPAIGEEVFAVGTPAGVLDFSVSKGVVSAVREIGGKTLLQTDASVNSGNSGGPLLDKTGHVVGIVTWKLRADQGYEGIAFAIPVEVGLRRLNLDLDQGGK